MKVGIQGERGSNSHMAAVALLGQETEIVPCSVSEEVIDWLVNGQLDAAVLPIENSLHGSVAEHYDLLLQQPIQIVAESLLRIRHNVIAAPGVSLGEIREVISHPVALSQCRCFLREHPAMRSTPFYDTAGSVKHLMEAGSLDVAALAPELAASVYGAAILVPGVEDHRENYTRFHLIRRQGEAAPAGISDQVPDKMTVAFAVEHRPGTLVNSLGYLAAAGADLTKIESRPVPGRPWEYVFYIEFRFREQKTGEDAVQTLTAHCRMVKELGRYRAAEPAESGGPAFLNRDGR